jgi:hypothetical protein
LELLEDRNLLSSWNTYGHDAQHSGISEVPAQNYDIIRWQTPVDLDPAYTSGGDILIHYGSPLVTPENTVVVPVKTGRSGGFRVEALSGVDGSVKWMQPTDYRLPPTGAWTPSYAPALSADNRLYFAGAGGTVYVIDSPDDNGAKISEQLVFYGAEFYDHSYDSRVFINTPITSDSAGNIYFGFIVNGPTSANLESGVARIDAKGNGTWRAAHTIAGVPNPSAKVVMNSAPALSNDGGTLYVAINGISPGYLASVDSTTLAPLHRVELHDPRPPFRNASLSDSGTASPTVGPDGDVYFGIIDERSIGFLLHFSADLSQARIPGGFGWDDTVSIVPREMVPSYTGSSSYLVFSKYNNYADTGGDGVNKVAILDPNASQLDSHGRNLQVMREVLTITGVTPDPHFPPPRWPNAVREWCINAAAVDPATNSVIVNSEDGRLYRWDLTTNTFTQSITLTEATGEAYTSTVIGVDGTAYATNNAHLFAIQAPGGPVTLMHSPVSNPGQLDHVRVTFSRSINAGTFTTNQVTGFTGPGGPISVSQIVPVAGSNNKKFDIFFPNQTLLGEYSMVLGPDIRDTDGNPMDQNDNGIPGEPDDTYILRFTIVGPRIVRSSPNDHRFGPVSTVRVTFNEPMNPATFTPDKIDDFEGPNGPIAITSVTPVSGFNNTQFDIRFDTQVSPGTYDMQIGPDIRDFAGHQMDQDGNFIEGEPDDVYDAQFVIVGPRIIDTTPQTNPPGGAFPGIDHVRVTFNTAMDPTTFTPDQVHSFIGPNGPIAIDAVSPVPFTSNTQFEIRFAPQSTLGNYTMVIGPDIADFDGNLMDQNADGMPGEAPYTARFSIVGTTTAPDGFGHRATVYPFEDLDILGQPGTFTLVDSGGSIPLNLGTNVFRFYGHNYSANESLYVSSKGIITFGSGFTSGINSNLRNSPQQAAIVPLWNDWVAGSGPAVLGKFDDFDIDGVPHRLIIQWNRVRHNQSVGLLTFQAILALNTGSTDGAIIFNYPNLQSGDAWYEGNNSTVGIKEEGTQGETQLVVGFNDRTPFVGSGQALQISTDSGSIAPAVLPDVVAAWGHPTTPAASSIGNPLPIARTAASDSREQKRMNPVPVEPTFALSTALRHRRNVNSIDVVFASSNRDVPVAEVL